MNAQHRNSASGAAPAARLRWLWQPANGLGLLAGLWLAWWLLAQQSFLYPVWYDWLSIDAHIAQFGPQNRFRQGLEQTTEGERLRLFAAIVEAIHAGGAGLDRLHYRTADGVDRGPMLRAPEIQHLVDVARLVDLGRTAGWTSLAAWLALCALLLWWRVPVPSARRQLLVLLGLCATATLLVLAIGPKAVFYAIHEWIFPPGHPWFFYYQDSLMTTLMKAPDLFAGIAASWALLAIGLVGLQWWVTSRWARARARAAQAVA